MNKSDLELFKEILKDDSIHFTIGQVKRVTFAEDGSSVTLECDDIFHGTKIICIQAFGSIGDRTGSGDIADPKDLVVIAVAVGDLNHSYALGRLPSGEEQLPQQMKNGHYVTKAKPGKKLYLGSDTKTEIGNVDPEKPCTEPLVLGLVLTMMLTQLIDKASTALNAVIAGPVGIGNLGAPVPTDPGLIASLTEVVGDLATLQSTFLETPATNIVSQAVFTERGGT